MQNKSRLIRLVIYLMVSIGLIILLLVIQQNSSLPDTKKETTSEEGIPLDLPEDSEITEPIERINIAIDSNNNFYINSYPVSWNELKDSISVQHEKEPKLSILLSVHKKAKSGNVSKILDVAKEKKMKVGITTLNE